MIFIEITKICAKNSCLEETLTEDKIVLNFE